VITHPVHRWWQTTKTTDIFGSDRHRATAGRTKKQLDSHHMTRSEGNWYDLGRSTTVKKISIKCGLGCVKLLSGALQQFPLVLRRYLTVWIDSVFHWMTIM